MNPFSAVFRLVGAFFTLFTHGIDAARKKLMAKPAMIEAEYDSIIKEKSSRIRGYKQAVGRMIAQETEKTSRIKGLRTNLDEAKRRLAGAGAKAKAIAVRYNGDRQILSGVTEFTTCEKDFKRFEKEVEDIQKALEGAEASLKETTDTIKVHETNVISLLRDIEKIKQEKPEAVASILAAKEQRDIADMLNGIGDDDTGDRLNELRSMRQEAEAQAISSQRLAGITTASADADYLNYSAEASSGFDSMVFGGEAKETVAAEAPKLPE